MPGTTEKHPRITEYNETQIPYLLRTIDNEISTRIKWTLI
jgi:hypothetical protein